MEKRELEEKTDVQEEPQSEAKSGVGFFGFVIFRSVIGLLFSVLTNLQDHATIQNYSYLDTPIITLQQICSWAYVICMALLVVQIFRLKPSMYLFYILTLALGLLANVLLWVYAYSLPTYAYEAFAQSFIPRFIGQLIVDGVLLVYVLTSKKVAATYRQNSVENEVPEESVQNPDFAAALASLQRKEATYSPTDGKIVPDTKTTENPRPLSQNATQDPNSVLCTHCGKEISADSTFCRFCGGEQAPSSHEEQ